MIKPKKPLSRNQMIFLRLQHSDPREIYGQLLTICNYRNFNPIWVDHKFKAIFGKWPKPNGAVELIPPDSDLLSWIKTESRKWGLRKGREEDKLKRAMGSTNGRQSGTASLPTKGPDDALDAGTDRGSGAPVE